MSDIIKYIIIILTVTVMLFGLGKMGILIKGSMGMKDACLDNCLSNRGPLIKDPLFNEENEDCEQKCAGMGSPMGTITDFLILFSTLIIPILLKSFIAFIFLKKSEIQIRFRRIMGTVMLSTIASFPFMFYIFISIFSDGGSFLMRIPFIVLLLIIIIFVEGLVIKGINKKFLTFKKAVVTSLTINVVGVLLAMFLFLSLPFMYGLFRS